MQGLQADKRLLNDRLQRDIDKQKSAYNDLLQDRKTMGEKLAEEKQELLNQIDNLQQVEKRAEVKYSKLSESCTGTEAALQECSRALTQLRSEGTVELSRVRQECTNDVAQLKDTIADLRRRNEELTTQLSSWRQNNRERMF